MSLTPAQIQELQDSVISAYNFDEGAGTTAFDSKGSNDLNVSGAKGWTDGLIGGGLDLDTTGDFVKTSSHPNIGSSDFTVSVWFNVQSFPTSSNYIIWLGDDSNFYTFRFSSDNNLAIWQQVNGFNAISPSSIKTNLNTNEWYKLTFLRNGTTIRVYINNKQEYTNTSSNNSFNIPHNMYLGASRSELGRYRGYLDILFFYDKGINSDEVTFIYNSGAGIQYPFASPQKKGNIFMFTGARKPTPTLPVPISYYTFDEGSGTTAFDSVGSVNGTLSSGTTWTTSGRINGGVVFNSDNHNVVFGQRAYPRDKVSMGIWVNISSFTGTDIFSNMFISHSTFGANTNFYLSCNSTQVRLAYVDTTITRYNLDVTYTLPLNTWILIGFDYNNTGDKTIRFNGNVIASQTSGGTMRTYTDGNQFTIMNQVTGLGTRGTADEHFIMPLLGDTEWVELYNSGAGKRPPFA